MAFFSGAEYECRLWRLPRRFSLSIVSAPILCGSFTKFPGNDPLNDFNPSPSWARKKRGPPNALQNDLLLFLIVMVFNRKIFQGYTNVLSTIPILMKRLVRGTLFQTVL